MFFAVTLYRAVGSNLGRLLFTEPAIGGGGGGLDTPLRILQRLIIPSY